ncbi:MAG: AAA family ATPase [Candidatus Obscuribacterales bacterium]|nr:AAA family ATPase [Candidatus Obscuribacterales bacterium]
MSQIKKNKIICVANQKGGVAKTTTAAYLGAALARLNRYVLLIDSDPQCSLTYSMELDEAQQEKAQENNLATMYETGSALEPCLIKVRDSLSLIPGAAELMMSEVALDTNAQNSEPERLLKNALVPFAHRFDYTIIDCPPSQGMLTLNALVAADYVLIPTVASTISLTGLERMIEQVHEIVHGDLALNPELAILGVLLTRFRRDRNVELEIEEKLRSLPEEFHVFRTVIPDRSQFGLLGELKAQTGRHLMELSMVSYSLLPYLTLAMEVEKLLLPKTALRQPLDK